MRQGRHTTHGLTKSNPPKLQPSQRAVKVPLQHALAHSDTSVTGLYAVSSVLLGISVIAVAVRFYARYLKKNPLLADDWLLIPALVSFIIFESTRDSSRLNLALQLAFIGACSYIYFGRLNTLASQS